ncbi:MAG TPA: NYN domain-containing protein [Candidatus Limnocylindrales bacterium]
MSISSGKPRTRVYIDGFNFYYSAYDRAGLSQYKWLNLVAMCRAALPHNDIDLVRYFTAKVGATPSDPGKPQRQEAYLQVLRTLAPGITLDEHFGQFVTNKKYLRLLKPPKTGNKRAGVSVNEEKGSDVNLASYLLLDAFQDAYDVAFIISNDSDLLVPARMVKRDLGKNLGVLRVDKDARQCVFAGIADFIKPLRESHFANNQFPDPVLDARGRSIRKPPEWAANPNSG